MKINFKEKILVGVASIHNIRPSPNNILYSYSTNKSLHIIDSSTLEELYSQHLTTPIHRLKWSDALMFFVLLSKSKTKLEVIKFSTSKNDFIPFYSISSKESQIKYFKVISSFLILIEEFSLSLKFIDLHTKRVLIITDPKFSSKTTLTYYSNRINKDNKDYSKTITSNSIENVCILRRIDFEDIITIVDLNSLKIISEFKVTLTKRSKTDKTYNANNKHIKSEISFIKQINETLILLVDNTNSEILIYTIFGHLRNSFYSDNLRVYFPFVEQINIIKNDEILLYNYNNEIVKINRITEEVTVLDIKTPLKHSPVNKTNTHNVKYFIEEEKKMHFINNETEILSTTKPFKISKFTTITNYGLIKSNNLEPYLFIKQSLNKRFVFIVLEYYRNYLFVLNLQSFSVQSILKLKNEIKNISTNEESCLITTGNRDIIMWTNNECYTLKVESSVCRKVNDFIWEGNKIVIISNGSYVFGNLE